MNLLQDIFIFSYFGGLFWIVIGVFSLKSFKMKTPFEKKDLNAGSRVESSNVRRVGFGLGSIGLGLVIIIFKILGKI